MLIRIVFLFAACTVALQAQRPPSVDDAKRAINRRLQKIWTGLGQPGTRTVVFENIIAGSSRDAGRFPFRASLLIHDYTVGYPANRFYGTTCVGHLQEETFTLSPDEFGAWDAQGRMTPDLSAKTCKNNTTPGIPSIPVSSLQGTRAGEGTAMVPPQQMQQQQQQTAAGVAPGGGIAAGAYECWANGQARMLLNFTSLGGNRYRDGEGHVGTMTVGASDRVTIRGGNLDGFMPAGYYATYYAAPGKRPTLSFRNSEGRQVQYCEKQ